MRRPAVLADLTVAGRFAHLSLPQLVHRRLIVWHVARLLKSAKARVDKAQQLAERVEGFDLTAVRP